MTSIILQGIDLYLRSQETNNISIAFLYVCTMVIYKQKFEQKFKVSGVRKIPLKGSESQDSTVFYPQQIILWQYLC